MRFVIGDGNIHADYIETVRIRTLDSLGVAVQPNSIKALAYANYCFALDDSDQFAGLAEAYFLQHQYKSANDCFYSQAGDLERYCTYEKIAHMRTIFVEPMYRTRRPLYVQLYLTMAKHFSGLGAEFATACTTTDNVDLCRLYERTGGQTVGTFKTESMPGQTLIVFIFQLANLLQHQRTERTRFEVRA